MAILVTGGLGFIGSHTIVELANLNYDVLVLDNLSNSTANILNKIEEIIGKKIKFVEGDVRDYSLLKKLFNEYSFEAVIHFAGLKAVGESVAEPLLYYDNNVHGTQVLLKAMQDSGVFNFVFSSSATVYGEPEKIPISESSPTGQPTSPYGRSKLMVEEILSDLAIADSRWCIAVLRYFNPIGAHVSGLIGENPKGIPNNLLPYIAQVAIGKRDKLLVFGGDYSTQDGTGVRDYIHVVDLAKGHLATLNYLQKNKGIHTWNLGTGQGYSVLQIIKAFEQASGVAIPYEIVARRAGDIAIYYANPNKSLKELGWQANKNLSDMMKDTWRWQKNII